MNGTIVTHRGSAAAGYIFYFYCLVRLCAISLIRQVKGRITSRPSFKNNNVNNSARSSTDTMKVFISATESYKALIAL